MLKIWIVLIIAFVFEAFGVIALKKGLDVIGPRYTERKASMPVWKNVLKLVGDWFTNKDVLLGVLLETIFFILLQYLLGQRDVSFVWPLTALTFVTATLAAKFLLNEHVDGVRWSGVALIVVGAVLIGFSEQTKPKSTALPSATTPPPSAK
jgi:multidrug transporter EmrE-like cation transporter